MLKIAIKISLTICFGIFVLCIFSVAKFSLSWQLVKKAEAANIISCSVTPFVLNPGEDVTISAVINFTAADVWAVIENEAGETESHYSLVADDPSHYSKTYTTSDSADKRYDIGIFATVDGTGEQVFCNPSAGSEWIKKSLNEISWSRRFKHGMFSYKGKLWLIGGMTQINNSDVWLSDDGSDWQRLTNAAPWGERRGEWRGIVFNNKLWLMGGYKFNADATELTLMHDVWNTSDGINWTQITAAAGWSSRTSFGLAAYNNKLWVVGGCTHTASNFSCDQAENDVWYSTDGASWTEVMVDDDVTPRTSHQLINFDDGNGEKLYLLGGVSYSPTTYYDDVWYSADGADWALATDSPGWENRYLFSTATFNDKLWVIGGYVGATSSNMNDVWSTSNGTDWTEDKAEMSLPGLGYQPSKWTHWAKRNSMAVTVFDDGTGDKLWLSGGTGFTGFQQDIWKSSDGASWTMVNIHGNAEFGRRFQPAVAVYNNRLWLMGGYVKSYGTDSNVTNDVWSSADGISWRCDFGPYTAATHGLAQDCRNAAPGWQARWDHHLVAFDEPADDPDKGEQMFLIGGCQLPSAGGFTYCPTANELRDVWSYDSDTDAWVQETASADWTGRYGPAVTTFDNKIYMLGGNRQSATISQQVWYSTNGANWTQATDATWTGRNQAEAVVYDGKLWIMGGWTGARASDVWSSTDPINNGWTQATSDSAWPARYTFTALNYNERMWVISGNIESANSYSMLYSNDAWWSVDGSTWYEATTEADFIGRDFFGGAVFNDRIWLVGGDSNAGTLNDVWASRYSDMSYYVMQPQNWQVNITAAVEASLSFELPADTTCNLDVLTTDKIKTCGYSITIITNAANGYTGSISQNQSFKNQSSEISAATDYVHATGEISGEFGEYGISVITTDTAGYFPVFTGLCSDYNNQSSTNLPAKGLPDTANYTFASSATPTNGVSAGKTSFCHGARIKWNAPPGTYSNIITLTIVGNY